MTLTFTVDPLDEHQTALRGDGGVPKDMPVGGPAPGVGDTGAGPATSVPSLLWRVAAALRSQLLGKRRRLPPEDDHLRRDLGLPERVELPHYWDFTRLDP